MLDNANLEEIWNVSAHVKLELPRRRMMFTLNPKLCYRKIAEFVESGVVLERRCRDATADADSESDSVSAAGANRSSAAAAGGEWTATAWQRRASSAPAPASAPASGSGSDTELACQIERHDRDNWRRNNGNSLCNVRPLHISVKAEATQATINWRSDDSGPGAGITTDPNVQRHIISLVIYYREAPSQDLTIFRCANSTRPVPFRLC